MSDINELYEYTEGAPKGLMIVQMALDVLMGISAGIYKAAVFAEAAADQLLVDSPRIGRNFSYGKDGALIQTPGEVEIVNDTVVFFETSEFNLSDIYIIPNLKRGVYLPAATANLVFTTAFFIKAMIHYKVYKPYQLRNGWGYTLYIAPFAAFASGIFRFFSIYRGGKQDTMFKANHYFQNLCLTAYGVSQIMLLRDQEEPDYPEYAVAGLNAAYLLDTYHLEQKMAKYPQVFLGVYGALTVFRGIAGLVQSYRDGEKRHDEWLPGYLIRKKKAEEENARKKKEEEEENARRKKEEDEKRRKENGEIVDDERIKARKAWEEEQKRKALEEEQKRKIINS